MTQDDIVNRIKSINLGTIYTVVSSFAATCIVLYSFSGPIIDTFVRPAAAQAIRQVLKDNGLDPEVLKDVKEQSEQNGADIADVNTDIEKLNKQVLENTLTVQNTDRVVQQLLRLELSKIPGVAHE